MPGAAIRGLETGGHEGRIAGRFGAREIDVEFNAVATRILRHQQAANLPARGQCLSAICDFVTGRA